MLEHLFELRNYEHNELFADPFPWLALDRLQHYLEKMAPRYSDPDNRERVAKAAASGVHIERGELIWLGHGTLIEPGAFLRGPLLIGDGCEIRHAAYLRGLIVAGEGCVFGHATEAVRSILLNGSKAPHFAYLGDTIVGNNVNLGAGTKCANLRFDQQKISVNFRKKSYLTHRRKLGAILGDQSSTGCNSCLNPGTILEKGSLLFSPVAKTSKLSV